MFIRITTKIDIDVKRIGLKRYRLRIEQVRSVLRIRDVYPGSWILIFIHPGSKISTKRGGYKFFCTTIFCSHKHYNIVNNLIFEQVKTFFFSQNTKSLSY
jgi:hypothetical protein